MTEGTVDELKDIVMAGELSSEMERRSGTCSRDVIVTQIWNRIAA